MSAKQRRRSRGNRAVKVAITVDVVTNAAVKEVMRREDCTYSAAICALATNAALRDPELAQVIRDVVAQAVKERIERDGWTPGLSEMLAQELLGGNVEAFQWN